MRKLFCKKFDSDDDIKALKKALYEVGNIDFNMPEKNNVKKHLFSVISGKAYRNSYYLNRLESKVRGFARRVFLPDWDRIMIKERVLEFADSRGVLKAEPFFFVYKRVLALIVMTFFALSFVILVPENESILYAKSTFFENVVGEVFVKRDLETIKAYPNMYILEGDIVFSEGGSFASIRFFDNSVGRINEYTRVKISKLYCDPENDLFSDIDLFLEDGRLWAKVFKLSENSSFGVGTELFSANVDSKATFDVLVGFNSTRVSVYENVVDVLPNLENASSKTLIAGYKAEVSLVDSSPSDVVINKMPRNEVLNINNDDWIVSNLNDDKSYTLDMISYKEKDILSSSDVRINDKNIDDSDYMFYEEFSDLLNKSESLLVVGEKEEGIYNLKQAVAYFDDFNSSFPALLAEDENTAKEIKSELKEKISTDLNRFSSFLPDNNLYKVKESLLDMELALADTDVQRLEISLRQAGDLLFEIETLISLEKPHLASTLLKRYRNKTNNISLNLTEDNVLEVKERFNFIMKGQSQHMKTLTAIENSIIYKNQNELKKRMKVVREETLLKFIKALDQMPELVPFEVLNDVNDLYNTYFIDDLTVESDILEPSLLKHSDNSSNGVLFLPPDSPEVPNEMGIFIMIPLEGTSDVTSRIDAWN